MSDPVAANDAGDVLAYSLSGTDAAMFDIDIATGQLKTKGKLNREATNGLEHMVTVTAVDPFGTTDDGDGNNRGHERGRGSDDRSGRQGGDHAPGAGPCPRQ